MTNGSLAGNWNGEDWGLEVVSHFVPRGDAYSQEEHGDQEEPERGGDVYPAGHADPAERKRNVVDPKPKGKGEGQVQGPGLPV